jgi:Leu/Phe-tRNA-protein transferase
MTIFALVAIGYYSRKLKIIVGIEKSRLRGGPPTNKVAVTTLFKHKHKAEDEDQFDDDPSLYIPAYLYPLVRHYRGDYYISHSFDTRLIVQLMAEGFVPLVGGGGSCLMPRLHKQRCVVRLNGVGESVDGASNEHTSSNATHHVSRTTRKKSKRYELSINTSFDGVIAACHEQHGVNWLYPNIVKAFRTIHQASVKTSGGSMQALLMENAHSTTTTPLRLYSIELWNTETGTLAAGELGYSVGSIYTSLTGFSSENHAGSIQLAVLKKLLVQCGFDYWDLGGGMEYKFRYGAEMMERDEFVKVVRECRGEAKCKVLQVGCGGSSTGRRASAKELLLVSDSKSTAAPSLRDLQETTQDRLTDLPEESMLSIASFLSTSDIRELASTNHDIRVVVLASQGALEEIWLEKLQRKYPLVFQRAGSKAKHLTMAEVSFVDDLGLPTHCLPENSNDVNLPLLTGLMPNRYPQVIDPKTLLDDNDNALFHCYRRVVPANALTMESSAIQFVGEVGVGDRCITSDEPFPSHCCKSYKGKFGRLPTLKKFSRDTLPSPAMSTKRRPFVIPTVIFEQHEKLVVDLTPRYVSYFEVTILVEPHEPPPTFGLRSECIAIGLSTKSFNATIDMPGWDVNSYGYHGDDGGIFHKRRKINKQPTFGAGDTVGCGLDHIRRRIFFVKNGEFLGYAFDKIRRNLDRGLFPTVGVDSKCPLFVNFGEKPFWYDLKGFVKEGME